MASTQEVREGVRRIQPDVVEIQNAEPRDMKVAAWAPIFTETEEAR
jgi:hypothetical protein